MKQFLRCWKSWNIVCAYNGRVDCNTIIYRLLRAGWKTQRFVPLDPLAISTCSSMNLIKRAVFAQYGYVTIRALWSAATPSTTGKVKSVELTAAQTTGRHLRNEQNSLFRKLSLSFDRGRTRFAKKNCEPRRSIVRSISIRIDLHICDF